MEETRLEQILKQQIPASFIKMRVNTGNLHGPIVASTYMGMLLGLNYRGTAESLLAEISNDIRLLVDSSLEEFMALYEQGTTDPGCDDSESPEEIPLRELRAIFGVK